MDDVPIEIRIIQRLKLGFCRCASCCRQWSTGPKATAVAHRRAADAEVPHGYMASKSSPSHTSEGTGGSIRGYIISQLFILFSIYG